MHKDVRAIGYVPDFDFLWEAVVSGDVRVGFVNRGDEDVLPIRRGIERVEIPGFPKGVIAAVVASTRASCEAAK